MHFANFSLQQTVLDVFVATCHYQAMAKIIAKVSGGESSFRIVIPRYLVHEMGWENVEYVAIRKCSIKSLEIRRLFDDEASERQDH